MPSPDLPKSRGYKASQNEDGSWCIRGVPVFAELPAGARGNQEPIGQDWLQAAVDKAQARFSERYVAPTHVNHHKGQGKTKPAGFFRPTDVRPTQYEGKLVWTVFADLINVPPAVFEAMERGELPYRSVEIHDWNTPEINSLALLDTEVPFFRFEIMQINRKEPATAAFAEAGCSPAIATFTAGAEARVLFLFGEDTSMPDPDETPLPDEEVVEAPAPEATEEEPGEGMSFEDRVLDGLEKLSSAVMQLMQDDEEEAPDPDSAPVEEAPEEEPEPANAMAAATPDMEIASLSAENRAFRSAEAQRKDKERISAMVAGAQERLSGFALDDETVKELHTFAAKGPDVLETFVASYERTCPKDPPATVDDFEATRGAEMVSDPDCVMQFANRGPDALEKARAAAAEHAELAAHCSNFTVPLETHVAMAVDGVSLGR